MQYAFVSACVSEAKRVGVLLRWKLEVKRRSPGGRSRRVGGEAVKLELEEVLVTEVVLGGTKVKLELEEVLVTEVVLGGTNGRQ